MKRKTKVKKKWRRRINKKENLDGKKRKEKIKNENKEEKRIGVQVKEDETVGK